MNRNILTVLLLVVAAATATTAGITTTTLSPTSTTAATTTMATAASTTTTASAMTTTAKPTSTTAAFTTTTAAPTTTTVAQTTTKITPTTNTAAATTTIDSTAAPTADEGSLGLGFRMIRTFLSDYSDSSTTAYQELAANVTTEVNRGYKIIYPLTYLRCRIMKFASGSIIVNITLIFKNQTVVPNATSAEQGLTDSLSHGNTFLNIDPTSITA
ncbi:unnamed protein product, partial [Coregonus sp. 'balchen']